MFIKVHLSGIAIGYDLPERNSLPSEPKPGRPQGSRYSQQKRAIADATEYMRLYGKNKPCIFVATSPGFVDYRHERGPIKALTHYLRRRCDCVDYLWVREFTGHGFPHWHFIADMPLPNRRPEFRDFAVELSRYWSSLFGCTAQNSVRFGTKPPKRRYFVEDQRMCRYLCKYMGKSLSDDERRNGPIRSFQISQNARRWSQPVTYHKQGNLFNGAGTWTGSIADPDGEEHIVTLNPYIFAWKKSDYHDVWFGIPKRDTSKNLKITEDSQKISARRA